MPDFLPVAPLASLREGWVVSARVKDVPVALYLVVGEPLCTEDRCTHEDNFLSDGGYVEDDEVECAYHGARFNVRTGGPARYPASYPLRTFPVRVRDGQVYVAID